MAGRVVARLDVWERGEVMEARGSDGVGVGE